MYFLQTVTADTASDLVEGITNILDDTSVEDQTTDNLALVTNVLDSVVGLLDGDFNVSESVSHTNIFDLIKFRAMIQTILYFTSCFSLSLVC